jgi:hypothetical protein
MPIFINETLSDIYEIINWKKVKRKSHKSSGFKGISSAWLCK